MKFIFVRHGETEDNVTEILARDDTPLTKEGVGQIKATAKTLCGSFDVIAASPLPRAQHSAALIAEICPAEIITCSELSEKSFGSLHGTPLGELEKIRNNYPEHRDGTLGYSYQSWGGESGADIKERITQFIVDMKKKYPDKRVLAVTHAGIIRLVHVLYGAKEYRERVPVENASIHEFDL